MAATFICPSAVSDLSLLLERLLPTTDLSMGSGLIARHNVRGLDFDCLHLEQIDPLMSGNKVFKLLGHLHAWEESGRSSLISFGGRWSNHLHALAFAAQRLNIPVEAWVLGYPEQPLTPTLQDCIDAGMRIRFCGRDQYAMRYDEAWRTRLAVESDAWVIPEGGDGPEGREGFGLLASLFEPYDEVWVAAGTGTTAQGIAEQLRADQTLVIVNAVQDQGVLEAQLKASSYSPEIRFAHQPENLRFGKLSPALGELITDADRAGLMLDPVYTVRLLAAWLMAQDTEPRRSLLVHSGGLQGRRGVSGLRYSTL